jgi:malate synthase
MGMSVERGVRQLGIRDARAERVLTPDALLLLEGLHREFSERRRTLLHARHERQQQLNSGWRPALRLDTAAVREAA